jgi:hypothetical protein
MPKKLKLYVGFTSVGKKQSIGRTVLAHSQVEAKNKLHKMAGKNSKIHNFYEDMYSRRGARWSESGKRLEST